MTVGKHAGELNKQENRLKKKRPQELYPLPNPKDQKQTSKTLKKRNKKAIKTLSKPVEPSFLEHKLRQPEENEKTAPKIAPERIGLLRDAQSWWQVRVSEGTAVACWMGALGWGPGVGFLISETKGFYKGAEFVFESCRDFGVVLNERFLWSGPCGLMPASFSYIFSPSSKTRVSGALKKHPPNFSKNIYIYISEVVRLSDWFSQETYIHKKEYTCIQSYKINTVLLFFVIHFYIIAPLHRFIPSVSVWRSLRLLGRRGSWLADGCHMPWKLQRGRRASCEESTGRCELGEVLGEMGNSKTLFCGLRVFKKITKTPFGGSLLIFF